MKIWMERCCFGTFVVFALIIAIFSGFFLDGLIKEQAKEGVKMTEETYGLWGVIPGDTETYTIRNFTIFNFTNPQEFLYRPGTKPKFVEVGGFLYQEKSQFLNYNYSNNKEEVFYDYWLYFDLLKHSRDVNQKFTVLNVGPLGFWMQLDTAQISTFSLQGLGGLFVEMNSTIKTQALAQGISQQYLGDWQTFLNLCKANDLSYNSTHRLWNDPVLGINQQTALSVWVDAAWYKNEDSLNLLKSHFFPIPFTEIAKIMLEIHTYSESMESILNDYYCHNPTECSNFKLTIKQIATSGVTNDPPSGDKYPSICSTNNTCIGEPEIPVFLNGSFKEMFPDPKYQQLAFSEEWLSHMMTPYKNLLNIGFLQRVWKIGTEYDETRSEEKLEELRKKLELETKDHGFVIWEWLKYFTKQFVLKEKRGGTRQMAGLSAVFSQALYQVSSEFASWYLQDIYSFMTFEKIKSKSQCQEIMMKFLPHNKSFSVCEDIANETDYKSYYKIVEPCLTENSESFRSKHKLSRIEMIDYCDIDEDPSNVGKLSIEIAADLSRLHDCKESDSHMKCTQNDIIVKQLFNSKITNNPYDGYPHSPSLTANAWNQDIPTFEYQQYLRIANEADMETHADSDVRDLFTFDKLLNGPAVQELLILDDEQEFYKKYHWSRGDLLRNWIRFVGIEVGFGGFTQRRSCKEIFFGYEDPFLAQLRDTDTMMGGDPSISPFIAFNEPNMTESESTINKQSMNTGMMRPENYRQFLSYFNQPIITYNRTFFDGENVQWEMASPWAEDVPLQGTDGFAVTPNIAVDEKSVIFISAIARFANVTRKKTIQRFGLQLYDMRIGEDALQSQDVNPQNKKYYQTLPSFLNQSYQGFPLYASKNHFLGCESKWANRVSIVNQWGNKMTANEWDDTKIEVEPYTGTVFSATIFLQSNYYYQPNLLFPQHERHPNVSEVEKMLPIVNTFRSGNISEKAVNKYWGDLRSFKNWERTGIFFAMAIIGFSVMSVVAVLMKRQNARAERNKPSLLESESMVD